MRLLDNSRLFKAALSFMTGAGAVFLSVIAQDTHGARLLWLASSAGVLGGISAIAGYLSVHQPHPAHSANNHADPELFYVPPPNLPDPSRYFTGRGAELRVVSKALRPGRRGDSVRMCVVHGLGGVGKTQLAAAYAEERLTHSRSMVWWLSASSYERLRGELLELAACLGIPEHESKNVMLNRLWGTLRDSPGWLLVYDGAQHGSLGPVDEDIDASRQPLLPRTGHGEVLITTQQSEGWEHHSAGPTVIELSDLGAADGLAFLKARISGDDSEDTLMQLGTQLHWLPLALEQAGAYIAESEISVQEYLHQLPDFPAGQNAVAATFEVAIECVVAAAPVAEDLMRLCSFLASEDVRRDMLLDNRSMIPSPLREVMGNQAEFNVVVRRLSEYSLLRRSGDSRLGTVTYRMHPQVQFHVRQRMDEQGWLTWSQTAVQLVEAAFPAIPEQLDQRAACERLMPHVQAVTSEVVRAVDDGYHILGAARDPEALARLLHRAGLYQECRGVNQQHILNYFKDEVKLRELGMGDVRELDVARFDVARQLYRLADLHPAEQVCRGMLDQWSSFPDSAAGFWSLQAMYLRQLACILREDVRFPEALSYAEQAISIYAEHASDLEGLDRAVAEQEAGMIYRNAGQLTLALERYARAGELVPSRGSEEPRDHLVFRAMLQRDEGIVAQDMGDLVTSERRLRAAQAIFRTNRGEDDFETSQISKFLADVLRRSCEEFRARARETHHPLRRRRLLREARRRLREAEELLGSVVTLHSKRRETEEHKYAACLNKLGSLRLAQGRHVEALDALLEAERIYVTSYGPEHPYRAKTLSRLGAVLISTSASVVLATHESANATQVLRLAEAIFRARLGDTHPSLVAVYERLADCATDEEAQTAFRTRARGIRGMLDGSILSQPQAPTPLPAP